MSTEPDDIPADVAAERALLGSVLIAPYNVLTEARWVVQAGDFYKPSHQWTWEAMIELHKLGQPVDIVTVSDRLRDRVADPAAELWDMQNDTPASSRWRYYADVIIRTATSRRLIGIAADASLAARTSGDPYEVAANLEQDLLALSRQSGAPPDDLMWSDRVAELSDDVMPQWVVPGWLRQGDRTVLVAGEGVGKSVWTHQMAEMVAQGVNPMWPTHRFDPTPTLVIDLENPDYVRRERVRNMHGRLRRRLGDSYIEEMCAIWGRPSGIDLRSRSTAREIDAALNLVRPGLVILSPLYKSFRKKGREDHEDAAAEMQEILDDLRARYGFALIIEHHAPKGSGGARDMVPFGSSLWQRWPEYGVTLAPTNDEGSEAKVSRYRGDRVRTKSWPKFIHWGGPAGWPWECTFGDEGHPTTWDPS